MYYMIKGEALRTDDIRMAALYAFRFGYDCFQVYDEEEHITECMWQDDENPLKWVYESDTDHEIITVILSPTFIAKHIQRIGRLLPGGRER